MSKILKGLNESRNYGRDSWDSNMPGYQGDYGGAENFNRRQRDWDENDAIDARLRQQYAQRQEYEKSGKFWLKLKDTQRHLPAGPFIGKQAATQAAHELFKQQPELKGNLLLTAYGPDENVEESKEADYGADYQDMVKRVGQLAKEGPRKTVWDPVKRVYKTVPINPPKKEEVADEVTSAKPWSARDIELGRGSHLKNDKLEPGDKFEYGYFNKPKGSGTVIELVGSVGKESVTAKLDDGRTVKMPYLGSKPKNGYYIRKIIDKNTNEDFEKNVQDYAKLEKFVEFAKNKLESASGSTLDLVAKKLSEYEAENFVNSNVEKNVYKTRGYGFTPIITQLYLDEREKRGIEDTSNKPNSANYVNTPFGSITGPEAYWDVEISKWGGANGREIANDLINAGYVENKKEFLYMISLVKTMPELRQEIEDSGIKVGSLDEYIFYAKELKGQGLIGNQEYLNSPYNDEKLEKALAKQIKESKEQLDENLHKWFKEKWVRFGPDGKIRGDCARGDDSEGKPKCLPQSKAHALGKKGRASAAARKRREDPNPERSGKAINVNTKKKTDEEQLDELKCWPGYTRVQGVPAGAPGSCKKKTSEDQAPMFTPEMKCPHCNGEMVSEELMNEKKDACYYKVKSRYKVWPSAYASGALVKCRKKGAANWGNKSESVAEAIRNTAEFGSRYAEQLAQKVFDQNSNLDTSGRATELLNAGYAIARAELGKIASGIFRDEDFPSDFVSSYNWLKKQGVAEAGNQSPYAKLAQLKAKYDLVLKSPNPNLTTLRKIRDQIIKLEFDLGLKEGVAETKVSKYKDLGATKNTTHFIKNVTTGKIVSPHRSRQDAEDALVASMRDSNDEFKIVRARKEGVAEGLNEAVDSNYLYHSTETADTAKKILSSGVFKAGNSNQDATNAQVGNLPTVSFGRNIAYQLSGENVNRDYEVVFVVDRSKLEQRYKTFGTSQSRENRGLAFPKPGNLKAGEIARSYDVDKSGNLDKRDADEIHARGTIQSFGKPAPRDMVGQFVGRAKQQFYAPKSGGEFEEVVPTKTGMIPWKGMLVGFYLVPGKAASRDPELLNHPLRLDMPRPNQFVKAKQQQGVAEGLDQITEYRDRLLQYVKSLLPAWPEYVLKDWLVPNKGDFSNLPDTELKNGIMEKLKLVGLTPNSKWQLVPNMKFTMNMFDPKTKQQLIGRAGGKSDLGMQIPKDAERHATQAQLAQQQGGVRKEPVLLIKTANGYELLEGWHRTIQHFHMYPNGYTGPAYVAVAQGQQGVAEEQLDEKWTKKYKDSINCSNPKGFSQKAHCAGKKKNESFVKESAIMKGLK